MLELILGGTRPGKPLACAVLLVLLPLAAQAELRMKDDTGNTIVLAQPARRIVSLAPSVTEMLFEVGAGNRIIGTIADSDYPEAEIGRAHV